MSVPVNKEALILAITTQYDKLQHELILIPENLSHVAEIEGHVKNTQITAHNVVAYLVGWGELVIKWHDKKTQHLPVDFPETGYKWNQLGLLAQKFYKDYAHIPYPALLEKLDKTVKAILAIIHTHTNHQLYEEPWYDKWTLGRMIQFNTSSPYTNARGKIRRWKNVNLLPTHTNK